MDLKEYPIRILLISLFIVAIFSFGALLQAKNKPIIGLDTSGVDLDTLISNLNSTQEQAEQQIGYFMSDNPILAFGELVLFGIWGIIKLVINSTLTLVGIIFGGMGNVLGVPPMVLGILVSIIIIGVMFAAWKVIKMGK